MIFKIVSVLSAAEMWIVNPQCITLTCMAKPAVAESHNGKGEKESVEIV